MTPVKVLALCLGNICRSPLAEVVLREALAARGVDALVDSAGTGDWHVGHLPDPRSRAVARRHGVTLTHRARQIGPRDFQDFDVILAMDEHNLSDLRRLAPSGARAALHLMREFDPAGCGPVPDPYTEPDEAFEEVWVMLRRAAEGFAEHVASGRRALVNGA